MGMVKGGGLFLYWESRVGSGQWEEGKERGRRGGESDTWESTVGYVFEGTEGQRHVGFKGCSGSMHAHTYQLPLHVVQYQFNVSGNQLFKRVIKGVLGAKVPSHIEQVRPCGCASANVKASQKSSKQPKFVSC